MKHTWVLAMLTSVLAGCASVSPQMAGSQNASAPAGPQQGFMASLRALCGKAYAGRMVTDHPNDADLKGKAMIMHVRTCDANGVRIPLHVEDDRSRTWVLTTTSSGLTLKHDHRHKDGSEDEITQYGGDTINSGTTTRQALFERTGRPNSSLNVWGMEMVPGQRFIYEVTRPNRHVRFEFDLSKTVEPPPPPWGSEG
jgi:hypothetical protein